MKAINYILLLNFLFLVIACNPSDELPEPIDNGGIEVPSIGLSECNNLPFGEVVYFEGGDFTVQIDSILEDSRCPIDAICFWEGRAWVRLLVTDNSEETLIELITENSINQDSMLTAEYGDYLFVLKNVLPYPTVQNEFNQDDYSVKFSIEDAATYYPCDEVVIDNSAYENAQSADFFFSNVTIDGDCLNIEISAAGCDGMTWTSLVFDSGEIAESLPEQRFLKFKLNNEELCAAQFVRTFSFDLEPLRTSNNSVLLNIDGWEEAVLYSY